ncbi:MAG: tRNA (N6-isopentenyl adenosine(37)-C2)-methylthiotransferase MiaB [Clostridia bacterium]|nr:tRNA (N6-isopentenyl adenosine(37)-C2)-methylthiotransferase MiaB [Clostridia bacterium]
MLKNGEKSSRITLLIRRESIKVNIENQEDFIEKVSKLNDGKNMKYSVYTMGCQLNENDSEKISGMMEKMKYSNTTKIEEADCIIFNTCCVRENAEDKLFGKLGEVKKYKELKGTIIAICGCMMQEKHIVEKIKKSYPFVDIIFGTHTIHKLPEDLYTALCSNKNVIDILDIDGEVIEGLPIKRNDRAKASVTIMNGCNNFCTYCIVPYVRGRERSRSPENIINEIEELARAGYKEITLLGQNVNSYKGNGSLGITKFSELLRAVNKINGIEKIRFISPHPKDFTDDVIDAIRDCDKVCKMIHLPLQSGSSEVLKKMNRKYTKEQYLNLVHKMKSRIPNLTLSTDIIVGFPEETEEDFKDTLDVVDKVNFEQVFMFIYSRRVGTPADKMEKQIPDEVKHERFNRLKSLVESKIVENNKKYIGTIQDIIVEGRSKTNNNMLTGRTDSNKVINFEGDDSLIGKAIKIKIISEHMWYLKGEVV